MFIFFLLLNLHQIFILFYLFFIVCLFIILEGEKLDFFNTLKGKKYNFFLFSFNPNMLLKVMGKKLAIKNVGLKKRVGCSPANFFFLLLKIFVHHENK